MKKILTISIAAYNVEKYIDETLDSLIKSPAIDSLEILVVNDGSKDGTADIVRKYEKEYPTSVRLIDKENGGWGSTINTALSQATGKYFKLLDGDDWFETDNVSAFIDFLDKTDADMVLTQYNKVYEPLKEKETIKLDLTEYGSAMISDLDSLTMHALAIKTELVRGKISITEHCFYTDVEFLIKCACCATNVVYLPLIIYNYRLGIGAQSVSPASFGKNYRQHETVLRTILPIIYGVDKLSKFKKLANMLVSDHYRIYLYASISRQTFNNIKDFTRFLKKDYKQSYNSISRIKRIISSCYCLYRVAAKKLHKKHQIMN